jgi:diaminohydroxyphosphoribosylaminopyrimidine deaminase/5-amino-6-(5-phosphoribosylamino)uracil reductase
LSENHHILDGKLDTLVFTGSPGKYSGKTKSIQVDHSYELKDLLEELYVQKVISVLVEGGARLHHSFLKDGLWDEARIFTGKMKFSQGVQAPQITFTPDEMTYFGDTKLERFLNKENWFDT